MNQSLVVAVRCSSYDRAEVAAAVGEALSRLEPLALPKGEPVLLKPNCLSADHGPEAAVNTRAEVVEAVGRYLKERHQVRLLIADSGGMGTYGRTQQAYKKMGLDQTAERLGAELVNLETETLIWLESPTGLLLPRFQATSLLNRVAAVVNLPKVKTHLLVGLTAAVKNCLGLLPGSLKRAVHVQAPTKALMSRALVDIFAAIRPSLNIGDAVVVMEGSGPSQGQPRPAGWIIASTDGVALDSVAGQMFGFKTGQVATTALAGQAGLGQADRAEISLLGADWAELPLEGFKRPFSLAYTLATRLIPPGPAGRALEWLAEAKPRPDRGNCQACGQCVEACPAGALSLEGGLLRLDKKRCIECYCCLEHCPSQGLWVPRSFSQRLFGR